MSGEVFSTWIQSLVPDPTTTPNANFNKGQTLDPFETSLRVTKKYTEHLTNVENGIEIPRQNNIDLVKACILDRTDTGYVISQLGESVLQKWRELNIDNNSDADEFYRVFILILEGNKLNITKYVDMLSFWKEIKGTGDPIQLINNPSSLYLMGVLNQSIDNFNPWVLIQKNHLKFDPIGTIDQLKTAYQNELEVISRLVRIESIWQNDFRPKGRQIFCLAMDCVLSEIDDVISLINAQNMSHFMGSFSEVNLRSSFEKYSLLNVGQNTALVGDNRIFYGAPGTGKSTEAKKIISGCPFETITFHPATDYSSFVGYYKPISTKNNNDEHEIQYSFQAQHFLRIYVKAWKNLEHEHYLLIEEINRGNCAKIFGDIFQLLDRDEQGFSDYIINVDSDISEYLKDNLDEQKYKSAIKALVANKNKTSLADEDLFSVIALPNNLSLLATMNTSDQSLFPMDSAFKRRWNWRYIPISTPSGSIILTVNGDNYDWFDFVQKANQKIAVVTESEDKKIGTYFVRPKNEKIDIDTFVNKVLFYLWNDIFKEEYGGEEANNVFVIDDNGSLKPTYYSELYNLQGIDEVAVQKLLDANGINKI
jgi:hypothetical protein